MAKSVDTFRRWLGAAFLGIAVLMLILGQTLLAGSLHDVKFIFYWLACFAFTGLAGLVAIVDFLVLRRRGRVQQREMLEKTLCEITAQQANKRRPPTDTTNRGH